MIKREHFTILLTLAVAVWAAALYFAGVPLYWALLKPFSTVVTAITLAWTVFDRWVWRWRVINPWLVARPDLRGTWRGKLRSDWGPDGGKAGSPRDAYLVIRETYTTISLRLFTAESNSETLSAQLTKDTDSIYSIALTYRNTPRMLNRERSSMHHGSAILRVGGIPAVSIEGGYWTDRRTRGEIVLRSHAQVIARDLDHARTLQYFEEV